MWGSSRATDPDFILPSPLSPCDTKAPVNLVAQCASIQFIHTSFNPAKHRLARHHVGHSSRRVSVAQHSPPAVVSLPSRLRQLTNRQSRLLPAAHELSQRHCGRGGRKTPHRKRELHQHRPIQSRRMAPDIEPQADAFPSDPYCDCVRILSSPAPAWSIAGGRGG